MPGKWHSVLQMIQTVLLERSNGHPRGSSVSHPGTGITLTLKESVLFPRWSIISPINKKSFWN